MQKSRKDYIIDRILDVIIYGSFLTMIVYGLLKGFGVINTPVIVQQLPLITTGLGLLGFVYKVGRYVERIEQKFFQFGQRFDNIDMRLGHIDKDVEFLKQRI